MMFRNKRSGGVSAAVTLALLLGACSGGSGGTPSGAVQAPPASGQTPPPAAAPAQPAQAGATTAGAKKPPMPIADKLTELSFFVGLDARVSATKKSYGEVEIFPLLEKETNIKINFRHPPSGMENEQFNLMIASGDLADIISWGWVGFPGGPEKAIKDGVIIRLNDLIDRHAPNFKAFLEKNPDIRKEIVTDDGTIYTFPLVRGDKWQRYVFGFQLRQDWLDKVGKKVPETLDDWYAVLKAFKEQNVNGKGDVIPFGHQTTKPTFSGLPLAHFMSAWGLNYGFMQAGGKVTFGPYEPDYKEYLATMKKWYDEGLIDPDFAATDAKQFDAKITGHRIGAYGALLNGGMGRLSDLMKNDPNFKLVGAPMPKAKDGKVYNFHPDAARAYVGSGNAVSGTSKHATEAVKWLDIAYSEWGHNLYNFGIEGRSYNWVDGYPKFTDAVLKDPNLPAVNALAQFTIASSGGRFYNQDGRYFEQMLTYPAQREASKLWEQASTERQMPPVSATPEESSRLANIMNEIYTYSDEMFVKFITGKEPLDRFDAYIERMKQMKIEEAIQIQQGALERYSKR